MGGQLQGAHVFFQSHYKQKSSSGIVVWREQARGWQKKPRLDKPQGLSVEGAVGSDATAGTRVVWPESDR